MPIVVFGDGEMKFEDRQELDELFSLTYEELRRMASSVRRGDPSVTLSTTSLVHEAYLRLANSKPFKPVSLLHFKRIAARPMRRLLVEAARRRNAQKRGGGAEGIVMVQLDDVPGDAAGGDQQLLVLDTALNELAEVNPRQAAIVESRAFGGLEISEIAELLGIAESTVKRDWRAATAWLKIQLRKGIPG